MERRGVDDSSTEDPVRKIAAGCLVRGVRPGRGDASAESEGDDYCRCEEGIAKVLSGSGGRSHCCRVFLECVGIRA